MSKSGPPPVSLDAPPPTAEPASARPTYVDRTTGRVFDGAREMVSTYLARYGERARQPVPGLDALGYAFVRRGSTGTAVNVLDDHGVLLLLAPVMKLPAQGREALYRRLLELSFLATSDAAFAVDAAKDEVFVRALRRLSSLDYEEFEDLLETVGRTADEWDDALKREFGAR